MLDSSRSTCPSLGVPCCTLLTILFLAFARPLPAEQYVGRGEASKLDRGFEERAKRAAIQDALHKAVKAEVGDDAIERDGVKLSQRILDDPESFYDKLEVQEEEHSGTKYNIRIRLSVNPDRLLQAFRGVGELVEDVGMPRIVLLPDPRHAQRNELDQRLFDELESYLAQNGFLVVDAQRTDELGREAAQVNQLSAIPGHEALPEEDRFQRLLLQYNYDIIVFYAVVANRAWIDQLSKQPAQELEASARIIGWDNARAMVNKRAIGTAADPRGQLHADSAAMQKAVEKLGPFLRDEMTKWWKQYAGVLPLTVTLYTHDASYARVDDLEDKLSSIKDVVSVYPRRTVTAGREGEAHSEYQVNYKGKALAFKRAAYQAFESQRDDYRVGVSQIGKHINISFHDPEKTEGDRADWAKNQVEKPEGAWGALIEKSAPSIVQIVLRKPRDGSAELIRLSSGTGFFVGEDGVILTNHHVVETALEDPTGQVMIEVRTQNGQALRAKVEKSTTNPDLAVLRIQDTAGNKFPTLALGDSSEVRVGDDLVAIGHSLGGPLSAVPGMVSVMEGGLIRATLPVHPGNSGGPVFDREGKVVAISVLAITMPIFSESSSKVLKVGVGDITHHIPINAAKFLLSQ